MISTSRLCGLLLASTCIAILPARSQGQVDKLAVLPEFKIEQIAEADKEKNGSWISLAKDGKGRLLLGGQKGQPVTRITMQDGKPVKQDILKLPISEIMGMLWAYDTLYVDGSDGKTYGLFRLIDKDGDDQYESAELLREWKTGGEHGAHGLVLGPDGKIYAVCGNFVDLPGDLAPTSPFRNYADDLALPRAEDGNGFGAGRKPPGGYITRMDKDGKNCELFASGQRNTYDIAFNADGELFGCDSDMEWDWGTPWYRPIRVFHAISGGDTGFREGTAKWPEYYPDSLPAVVNIGIGSPTGVTFGTGAKFPLKYQKAMYVLDWTYGRVIAVHMQSKGAGYTATFENFVAPRSLVEKEGKKTPNNVTDVVIGDDGALYFTTGGRSTQGNLYRVTYTGKEPTTGDVKETAGAEARTLRHKLEQFHAAPDPKAIETAWPHLSSEDRFIRYAARLAIERQPIDQWKSKALSESNPQAALTALLALVRSADKSIQPQVLLALSKINSLNETLLLEKIRVIEVSIARHGAPSAELAKPLIAEFSGLFPAKSWPMNRELSQALLALGDTSVVAKIVDQIEKAPTQEEQVGYVLFLRQAKNGWTPELRKRYFTWWTKDHSKLAHIGDAQRWFDEAGRAYSDGSSFARFLGNFHAEAQKTLSTEELASLSDVLKAYTPPGPKPPKKNAKPRKFVKNWAMPDLEKSLAFTTGRNFNRGKAAFEAAQCYACHRFGNEGGAIGPDITAVSSRFKRQDILESILDPSKVVSEQYQNLEVRTKDGDVIVGRLVEDKADAMILFTDMLKPDVRTTVKKSDIKSVKLSKLSPMPQGLVDTLSRDEILDMLAFIEASGKQDAEVFKKK